MNLTENAQVTQGIIQQIGNSHWLGMSLQVRVRLLHADHLFNMVDMPCQVFQFPDLLLLVPGELFR